MAGPGAEGEQESVRRPAPAGLMMALERAASALLLVVSDIESTTSIRVPASILRYDDWVRATTQGVPPSDADLEEEEERLLVAARFGEHSFSEHSFSLEGADSMAELAADIAFRLQDDVIDRVRGAWPACPKHEHPLFPQAVAGVAVWICPVDPSSTVPIGQLATICRVVNSPGDPSSSLPV